MKTYKISFGSMEINAEDEEEALSEYCEAVNGGPWDIELIKDDLIPPPPLKCSQCFKEILGGVIYHNVLPYCEICDEEFFDGVNLGIEEELRSKE